MNMKSIVGFGALNLDLIFEVDDLKAISSDKIRLEPGQEFFGPDNEVQFLLELINRSGTLKSRSGGCLQCRIFGWLPIGKLSGGKRSLCHKGRC